MTMLEQLYNRKQSLERQLENSRNNDDEAKAELNYIEGMIIAIKEGTNIVVRPE
jgi:hypothetical protein